MTVRGIITARNMVSRTIKVVNIVTVLFFFIADKHPEEGLLARLSGLITESVWFYSLK